MTEPEIICQEIEQLDVTDLKAALQLSRRVMFQYAAAHIRKGCVCCVCDAKRMIAAIDRIEGEKI